MLDAQLVINDLLLLNFLLLKKRTVLCFHMDSFHDSIIVKNIQSMNSANATRKKNFYGFARMYSQILSINFFTLTITFGCQVLLIIQQMLRNERNPL